MFFHKRAFLDEFQRKLRPNKVLLLLGARRVGKTAFLKYYLTEVTTEKYLLLNGEDLNDISLLSERTAQHYRRVLAGVELLVIDEAQNVPDIGVILKFIVDNVDGIKVVATGSSAFDLTNNLGEPLVGRMKVLHIFPMAQIEYNDTETYKDTVQNLEKRLLFGGYPEIDQYDDWYEKGEYLNELRNSYLLKDILAFSGIKHSQKIYDLLRMIAYQIGKEVSLSELGNKLQMSKNTVEKYLDLLTRVFVIFRVDGFSRNLRKEITKSSRWYFYDNGIRNALIDNFRRLDNRTDVGDLWENYLAAERVKKQHYHLMPRYNYFWRTYDQQELDWLERDGESLAAFEFKWNKNAKTKKPTAFGKAYTDATFEVITPSNYLDFIT